MSTQSLDIVDPQGRRVTLNLAQYQKHIQGGHDEIDQAKYIIDTICDADSIWRETRYPAS